MTPMRRPFSLALITMIPLSDSRIRIVWQAPDHNGGAPIAKYVVQWDTELVCCFSRHYIISNLI